MATNPNQQPTQWHQQPTYPTGVQPPEAGLRGYEPTPSIVRPLGETPSVDVIDNQDELWVYLDLPGFSEDELAVRGDETTIVVNAQRFGEVEEDRVVLVNERPSRFERTIALPTTVDIDEADVSYEQGVCKIVLPKTVHERYKEIRFETT